MFGVAEYRGWYSWYCFDSYGKRGRLVFQGIVSIELAAITCASVLLKRLYGSHGNIFKGSIVRELRLLQELWQIYFDPFASVVIQGLRFEVLPTFGIPAGLMPIDDGDKAARTLACSGQDDVAFVKIRMCKDNGCIVIETAELLYLLARIRAVLRPFYREVRESIVKGGDTSVGACCVIVVPLEIFACRVNFQVLEGDVPKRPSGNAAAKWTIIPRRLDALQRQHCAVQFATYSASLIRRQFGPSLLQPYSFDEFEIQEDLLAIALPAVYFRHWDIARHIILQEPNALSFDDAHKCAPLDNQARSGT
jgi:hypothetical protein